MRRRFPFTVRDRPIAAIAIDIFAIGPGGQNYAARVAAPGEAAGQDVPVLGDNALGGAPHGRRDLPARPSGEGRWRIAIRRDNAANFTALAPDELADVLILVAYELG